MKFKLIIDPNQEEEIVATVHRSCELTDKIENLVLSYEGNHTVTAYNDDHITHLAFSDIACVTVIDRKSIAIGGDGTQYRIHYKLCELEDILPTYFIRINKSAIANERHIACFKTAFNGSVDAVFRCGYRDYVSRRCFAEIKRRMEK